MADTYWVTSSDPLFEPEDFHTYAEATARVRELAKEWVEEEGFTADFGWASQRNMFACRLTKAGRAPVTIEVNDEEPEGGLLG